MGRVLRLVAAAAVGLAVILSPVATVGAANSDAADSPVTQVPAVPAAPGSADFLEASEAAASEAFDDLAGSSEVTQARCADQDGVSVCLRRRAAVGDRPAPARLGSPAAPVLENAAVASETLGHRSQVCEGTGRDGFRVQPVYAYQGAQPDPEAVALISDALANVDRAFVDSAARTGGWRSVRWVTDSGSAGCRVVLRTARITTGTTDFDALMEDLEAQGAVPPVGYGTVKHLVWTEGDILERAVPAGPRPATCGLGESYEDESPLGATQPNLNLYGTRAAIDDRCWDLDGGGSIPAHELMHTLGAVQQGAPNYANNGHCDDEYDLMCYGPGTRVVCPSLADNALFDCGNDDYFNTDPLVGQYLCDSWNTSDSGYLQGWDQAQPPRAVKALRVSVSVGTIRVSHAGTASCYGADHYRISISGGRTVTTTSLSVSVTAPTGTRRVTVTPHSPYGDVYGTPVSVQVTVPAATKPKPKPKPKPRPNRAPVGAMVLSLTDGRGYGMLGWAIDPDTGGPTRMRVVIPGVANREYDWNYRWADMPARTGWNRTESLVFLARLPAGTHKVCFDAKDANTGAWHRLDCHTHSVK